MNFAKNLVSATLPAMLAGGAALAMDSSPATAPTQPAASQPQVPATMAATTHPAMPPAALRPRGGVGGVRR